MRYWTVLAIGLIALLGLLAGLLTSTSAMELGATVRVVVPLGSVGSSPRVDLCSPRRDVCLELPPPGQPLQLQLKLRQHDERRAREQRRRDSDQQR